MLRSISPEPCVAEPRGGKGRGLFFGWQEPEAGFRINAPLHGKSLKGATGDPGWSCGFRVVDRATGEMRKPSPKWSLSKQNTQMRHLGLR